jgi:ribosomal protein L17
VANRLTAFRIAKMVLAFALGVAIAATAAKMFYLLAAWRRDHQARRSLRGKWRCWLIDHRAHTTTSRAREYRRRAAKLTEKALRVRDEADRKHLLELAAMYRRAADQLAPPPFFSSTFVPRSAGNFDGNFFAREAK